MIVVEESMVRRRADDLSVKRASESMSANDKPAFKPARLPASPFVSPARSLADAAAGPLAGVFGKRGLAGADILRHWRDIVGAELARMCAPERIAWPRPQTHAHTETGEAEGGAVLHIRVEGPQAIEVQHRSGEIIERVNRMFGYAAIDKIRIMQAPLARRDRQTEARDGPAPAAREEGGDSADLASALSRLARGVKPR